MQIPAAGLQILLEAAPRLETLNFSGTPVPFLDGVPPLTLQRAVFRNSGVQVGSLLKLGKEAIAHAVSRFLKDAQSETDECGWSPGDQTAQKR